MIEATPDQVWASVRDIGSVHTKLMPGYVSNTRLEGDSRILTLLGGGFARELIVDIDEESKRLAYAVIEGRMPLVHHHASFQVLPEGENRSLLLWITDFLPDKFAGEINARVERGAVVMKQTIEDNARHH